MSKRGEVLYIFLAFAVIATIGLTYAMLSNAPTGLWEKDLTASRNALEQNQACLLSDKNISAELIYADALQTARQEYRHNNSKCRNATRAMAEEYCRN